jgi:hypothetical protein
MVATPTIEQERYSTNTDDTQIARLTQELYLRDLSKLADIHDQSSVYLGDYKAYIPATTIVGWLRLLGSDIATKMPATTTNEQLKLLSFYAFSATKDEKLKLLRNYVVSTLQKIEQSRITFQFPRVLNASTKLESPIFKESNQSNFKITQNRLLELLKEEEEDEDGYDLPKPTPYAFYETWNLLEKVSAIMKDQFPKARASTDGEGGIRLAWSNLQTKAKVRLIYGATPKDQKYIYHEQANEHSVIEQVSVSSLLNWLKWLNQV